MPLRRFSFLILVRDPMRHFAIYAFLVLAVLVVAWGAGLASFPLGVPGEWEWNRVKPSEPLALALVPVLTAAALYLGFVWLGGKYVENCRRPGLIAWLGGLTVAGFTWLWVAQESAPENYQLSKAAWILYYRGSSGYFSEARDQAADLPDYLERYERKMEEGDVLHIGTHPPGLIVALRGMMGVCRATPWLVDVLHAIEPASVRAAFDELKKREPLSPTDRAVLWMAALLVQAGAALTVIPLFGLLAMTCNRRASWQAAAFWPTLPALAIFLPKSDCLFPFLAMTFLWLWLRGLSRRSLWSCAIAGVAIWLGLSSSLAFLPIALIGLLAGIWNLSYAATSNRAASAPTSARRPESPIAARAFSARLRPLVPAVAAAAAGFAVSILALWWTAGINLPNVWRLNLHNHAAFYQSYPRTYWKWLLINPLEFAMAAGVPLVVLAAWSLIRTARRTPALPCGHVWAWLITIALLWISGKNMGEVARLWIILMPFLVWILGPEFEWPSPSPACAASSRAEIGATGQPFLRQSLWAVALGAQLVATALLVTQVVGFHPPEPVAVVANKHAPLSLPRPPADTPRRAIAKSADQAGGAGPAGPQSR